MTDKIYKSITEVSQLLNINKHVIRYWDSRFEGISTRRGKTKRRFFNADNIKKLQELRDILYTNGKSHHSLDLAAKLIAKKKSIIIKDEGIKVKVNSETSKATIEKLSEISENFKKILKSID